MRKILFNGKRLDNGEWVEGSLIRFANGGAMILPSNSTAYTPKGKNVFCSAECYAVDPATVGEYTGEKDKKGVKIFENYIVKTKRGIGFVNFGSSCFAVKYNDSINNPALDIVMNEGDIEVIGNMFDNPEMVKINTMFCHTERLEPVNISYAGDYFKDRYACGCKIVPGRDRCPDCGAGYY